MVFYIKGADSVMTGIVQYSDWLEEEVLKYRHMYLNKNIVECVFNYSIYMYG